jgi:hypothetical protein
MFDAFIDALLIIGAAVFKLLPKSFQREVDPDSMLGQALGLVLGILLSIGVIVVVSKLA